MKEGGRGIKTITLDGSWRGEDFITVQAEHYAHAVSLDGDYVFEDNFFSLMPCEAHTIRFKKACRTILSAGRLITTADIRAFLGRRMESIHPAAMIEVQNLLYRSYP